MESSKTLVIDNYERMVGHTFWNGRFKCLQAHETEVNYRWQFEDKESPSLRVVWIELSKFGKWDIAQKKYFYGIQNRASYVSAEWFTIDNAIKSFGEILKDFM